jgi:DNA repair protein RadC
MRHAPDPQPQAWGLPPRDASATRPACELGAIDLYDSKGRLIERIELTGNHHSLAIDLAHVIPRMLSLPCRTVILRHAHPSGLPTPSETDVAATRAFAALLRMLGMRLHDHVISGGTQRFSFRAQGLL